MKRFANHRLFTGLLLGMVLIMLHTAPLTGRELPAGVRRVKDGFAPPITLSTTGMKQQVERSGGHTASNIAARGTLPSIGMISCHHSVRDMSSNC
ncbi:MAG: hypothetical protein OEN22_03300 [Gammaproteobacteria bacterium]|nr:hypothetical protein [Gammaproteobacteria bacterium]